MKRMTLKESLNDGQIPADKVFLYYYYVVSDASLLIKLFAEVGLPPEMSLKINKHLVESYDDILHEHFDILWHKHFHLRAEIENFGSKRVYCKTIKDTLRWTAKFTIVDEYL